MWMRYFNQAHREKNWGGWVKIFITFEHSFAEEWGATSRRPFLRGTAGDIVAREYNQQLVVCVSVRITNDTK
jgi:hypothetical protein